MEAEFCLVEVINGVPEKTGSFFYKISPIMEISDDEIEDYYYDFKEEHNFGTNIPEGSGYSKSGQLVGYDWNSDLSEEELKNYQLDCIKKIEEWAEKLPPLK